MLAGDGNSLLRDRQEGLSKVPLERRAACLGDVIHGRSRERKFGRYIIEGLLVSPGIKDAHHTGS